MVGNFGMYVRMMSDREDGRERTAALCFSPARFFVYVRNGFAV
jgi:hypothetical protein